MTHTVLADSRWPLRLATLGLHAVLWTGIGTIAFGFVIGWIGATPAAVEHVCVGGRTYSGQLSVLSSVVVITEDSEYARGIHQDRVSHFFNRSRLESMTVSHEPCLVEDEGQPAAVKIAGMDVLQLEIKDIATAIRALKPTINVPPSSEKRDLTVILQQLTSLIVEHRREYARMRADDNINLCDASQEIGKLRHEVNKVVLALASIEGALKGSIKVIQDAAAPISLETKGIATQITELRARNFFERLIEALAGREVPDEQGIPAHEVRSPPR